MPLDFLFFLFLPMNWHILRMRNKIKFFQEVKPKSSSGHMRYHIIIIIIITLSSDIIGGCFNNGETYTELDAGAQAAGTPAGLAVTLTRD